MGLVSGFVNTLAYGKPENLIDPQQLLTMIIANRIILMT